VSAATVNQQAEPTTRVALEVHICDQRRSYTAEFASGDQAVAFMTRNAANHSITEMEDRPVAPMYGPVTPDVIRLLDALYPQCEHGLSLELCYGPQHYPSADDERAMGW